MINRFIAVRRIRTLSSSIVMKPPNIGIFRGTSDADVGDQVRTQLSKCLNVDRYAFVRIDESAVRRRDKWADNVILVVIGGRSTGIDAGTLRAFRERWLRGGKFLDASVSLDFVVGLFGPSWERKTTKSSSVSIGNTDCNYGLPMDLMNENLVCIRQEDCIGLRSMVATADGIVVVGTITAPETDDGTGIVLFSQIRFEVDTAESSSALTFWQDLLTRHLDLDCCRPTTAPSSSNHVTPCHLISSSEMRSKSFLESIGPHLLDGTELEGSRLTLKKRDDVEPEVLTSEHRIPLSMDSSVRGFDRETYFRHLNSRELGHVVIFGRILPSTMDLIGSYVAPHGLVVIADRQTNGRGRSDHCWLSPEGCAMFSVHVRLSLRSAIGHRPSFIQHLAAMAAVQGIRTLPGYENLDVRLKWPNDIYYGSSVKIGGIFVQSSVMADELRCVIGVGVNVSNGHPTMCINDIIRASDCPSLPELKPEVSIARTLSHLETLLDTFESDDGVQKILRQYYDLWIHENAEVKLSTAESEVPLKDAVIRGLDDDGFLVVQLTDDGSLYSVQPDGNSFDVLHNMVVIRRQTSTSFQMDPRT